jgi:AcrR family transcriptional regulator
MEDIAKRAGISKAAIYLYFPSKVALLEALIEAKVGTLAQQMQTLALAGHGDPLMALRMIATMAARRLADINLARCAAAGDRHLGALSRDRGILSRTHVVDKARGALEIADRRRQWPKVRSAPSRYKGGGARLHRPDLL